MAVQGASSCKSYSQHRRYASCSRCLIRPQLIWPRCSRLGMPGASIDTIGDDSLLKIFSHCRLALSDEDEISSDCILEGTKWDTEGWWSNLAQVCRRWRYLVLSSASHLRLFRVCTYGTPVRDKLAHLPALPLVIDYGDEDREVTTQDEEGILLALHSRPRVCRIRLWMSASKIRSLITAIDGDFPILEYLYIKPLTSDRNGLSIPKTFKAPHIRHLALRDVTYSRAMFRLPSSCPPFETTENFTECVRCGGPRLCRYAAFSFYVHRLVNEHDPPTIDL